MGGRTLYFLFTDTGTYLSRAINYCTKEDLNHVSISFDDELREVYSFGRKNPRNPFVGGFVKENIHSDFLKNASCAVYAYHLSDAEYEKIKTKIKEIELQAGNYKYNFLGLFGVMLQVEINREHAMFCSQFVATVLREVERFKLPKPNCFTTPADIRGLSGLQLIYQGKLCDYRKNVVEPLLISGGPVLAKQSFTFLLSKVKRFVIR
ncbi:hypothetical protein CFK37_07390 [Virgibacillus phasianinus]|uniref:Uncharacterized protein n=1 Tax=Virgibacillus phasianinus TaxID=2017483 RepID=A0A220U1S6_9BACI|nr:hypothetical protein [Virgibacillus phasianinus]ASK61995.1 hypothetical protein CFK37_07390 [Virgibacillus phasianinus]